MTSNGFIHLLMKVTAKKLEKNGNLISLNKPSFFKVLATAFSSPFSSLQKPEECTYIKPHKTCSYHMQYIQIFSIRYTELFN